MKSDEELVELLQRASKEVDGSMSASRYDQIAAANGYPTHQTMCMRFGSWNQAKREAGLIEVKPTRAYVARHSTEQCLKSVKKFFRAHPGGTTEQYDEWRAGQSGAPSNATIRSKLGGWRTIKRTYGQTR